jgi:hypothetical protein
MKTPPLLIPIPVHANAPQPLVHIASLQMQASSFSTKLQVSSSFLSYPAVLPHASSSMLTNNQSLTLAVAGEYSMAYTPKAFCSLNGLHHQNWTPPL